MYSFLWIVKAHMEQELSSGMSVVAPRPSIMSNPGHSIAAMLRVRFWFSEVGKAAVLIF